MSARAGRDQFALELESARKRIADLETALPRRGRDALTAVLRIEAFREQFGEELARTRRRELRGPLIQFDPAVAEALVAHFHHARAGHGLHAV